MLWETTSIFEDVAVGIVPKEILSVLFAYLGRDKMLFNYN